MVPYAQLDVPDPIAVAADRAGMGWMGKLIKLGAIAGLSSVILVMLLGQSRVFYSMARDGLLPPVVSRVHPRFRTPWITSIVTGIGVAFFSAVFTVREAGSLCSIGTLLAFVIVSAGVLVLRVREPNLERRFTTPWVWFVAPMGAVSAMALMAFLSGHDLAAADRLVRDRDGRSTSATACAAASWRNRRFDLGLNSDIPLLRRQEDSRWSGIRHFPKSAPTLNSGCKVVRSWGTVR